MKVIIITGQSGAGKSTALHVFEDMQMLTADGVPPRLLPDVARLLLGAQEKPQGLAVGIEQRQAGFVDELSVAVTALKELGLEPVLLFLTCDTPELMRRYATTRRPHPQERVGIGLEQAIAKEKEGLAPIRRLADIIIDTSAFSLHDLRRDIQRRWNSTTAEAHPMKINLISFGFKYGVPHEADLMFDMRFLPNPYFVLKLRPLCGCDSPVADYVFGTPEANVFRTKFIEFIRFILPLYENEGRYRLTVAIGCTGGRHRSVAMAEVLAEALKKDAFTVSVEHRHMNLD